MLSDSREDKSNIEQAFEVEPINWFPTFDEIVTLVIDDDTLKAESMDWAPSSEDTIPMDIDTGDVINGHEYGMEPMDWTPVSEDNDDVINGHDHGVEPMGWAQSSEDTVPMDVDTEDVINGHDHGVESMDWEPSYEATVPMEIDGIIDLLDDRPQLTNGDFVFDIDQFFREIEHERNQEFSPEELEVINEIARDLASPGAPLMVADNIPVEHPIQVGGGVSRKTGSLFTVVSESRKFYQKFNLNGTCYVLEIGEIF